MRDYGKVSPQFWTGKTGKVLRGDAEAQLVALYLMTSPHANMIGIYNLPVMYLAHETGLTIEGASKALTRLSEADFCTFEADTELVWVHEMAKYQIGEKLEIKDKRCKGVENELAKVPSTIMRRGFALKYKDDFHLQIEGKKSKPLTSPKEAPCKPEAETRAEAEAETHSQPDGFDLFYQAYPKKVGRPAAAKAFKAQKINGELPDIMADVEKRIQGADWQKDSGQYIPNPATYLNQRRWEDGATVQSGLGTFL